MNPAEHQDVPVGTVIDQDRNGPVTALRDYDTLVLDRWRLSAEDAARLRDAIDEALPGMLAARAEMAKDEAERLAHAARREG